MEATGSHSTLIPEQGSCIRCQGCTEADASLLRLPICGFLPADDERVGGAVCSFEETVDEHSPRMRYRSDQAHDGMEGGKGSFITCGSGWPT